MEMNRKRRGFMKGKLMPFYKSMKPSTNYNSSTTIDTTTATTAGNTVLNSTYVHQHDYNYVTATAHQPPQAHRKKVSFLAENNDMTMMSHEEKLNLLAEKLYEAAVNADESVDVRAATYISSVQERFKLERVNSERVEVHQDRSGVLETRS